MPIRIERTGGPPDLPAAFAHFIVHDLCGRALDDRKDEEARLGKFPDFACYRDLVLIEMKHLETEQNERINATYKSRVPPEEKPIFFGTRRISFDEFSNGDEIALAVLGKLARTIETHLSKANQQFEEYRARNPRKNSVSICFLLNSRISEFSPNVVLYAVHRKIQPNPGGIRFPHIDAVIYISEKHAQKLPDGRIAFAITQVVCAPAVEQRWKIEFIERITHRWSEFRTDGATLAGHLNQFESIEDIPSTMPRHEAWKLAYRRNPYLRGLTNEQLSIHFHRYVAFNSLTFVIGEWEKPTEEQGHDYMRAFNDVIEEVNHRGIDMRQLNPRDLSPQERAQAYAGFPAELIEQLSGNAQ